MSSTASWPRPLPFKTVALLAWLAVAAAAALTAAGVLSMGTLEAVPLCLFRRVWGVRCPGCGMGHALIAAFQGHWAESFRHHILGIPVLAVWTGYLARYIPSFF